MSETGPNKTKRSSPKWLGQVLLLAIVALWGVGYLAPALSQANFLSEEAKQAQRLAMERRLIISQRRQIIDRWQVSAEDMLPTTAPDATGLMRALANQAGDQKVQIVRLNPIPERERQGLREIGAEIEIKGQLGQIVRFVHELENGADPLVVKQLNLRVPGGDPGSLEARLIAVRYVQ